MSKTDNFTSTCFEYPVNEKIASTVGKNTSEASEKKKKKKKQKKKKKKKKKKTEKEKNIILMRLQMATKETLKNMWHNNLNSLMCVQLNKFYKKQIWFVIWYRFFNG